MIDYALILATNYLEKEWSLNGNSYEELTWLSDSPKPTQSELNALWESTQATITAKLQTQTDTKQTALNKLMALGLTEEEALALGAK